MSNSLNIDEFSGNQSETGVVEGATLVCTLGASPNRLQIPQPRLVFLRGKKRAVASDHIGGGNIMSFGPCSRAIPPPPCIMATSQKWLNVSGTVAVGGEGALTNASANVCDCGGVISVAEDGQ